MTVRFWDLLSHWIITAWLIGLPVFPLLLLGAIFTTLGQIYIVYKSRGNVNWLFVLFRIFSHYAPLYLSSRVVNIQVCTGLVLAYLLTLALRGKTVFSVYRDVFKEPSGMTLREYFERRSGFNLGSKV